MLGFGWRSGLGRQGETVARWVLRELASQMGAGEPYDVAVL